ncbi:MAG TPA: alpha/beta hydrolase [bacterium]|nr:alpha/beta hydrolase [bacterium]
MGTENIRFESGGCGIAGCYHRAEPDTGRAVIISHGFEGSKDSEKWIFICDELAAAGISALRFDHRGMGESEGLFEDTTLTGRIDDLEKAAGFARKELGVREIALLGSSFGGNTVLFAASKVSPACSAIVATPLNFDFFDSLGLPVSDDSEFIDLGERRIRASIRKDVAKYDIAAQAARTSRLLVMHGTADELIPPDHALEIHSAAAPPKCLFMIEGADHSFSEWQHRRIMSSHLLEWFSKFM